MVKILHNPTQVKIEAVTEQYKQLFPDDYKNVVAYVKMLKANLVNEYADLSKQGVEGMDRLLIEWPEMLHSMLHMKLNDDERKSLFEDKNHKLIRWYANKYPEFRVSKTT